MKKLEVVKTLIEAEKEIGLVETLHQVFGKDIKVTLGFAPGTCHASVDELALSVRSWNALRRDGVFTIGDLIERLNEGDLKKIRNLGDKSYREIQTKMLVFGFDRLSDQGKQAFFRVLVENNAES
jgi:DNA-directed RNA polymerase alpha subunit